MRILITYARRPPYPPFGIHLTAAFRALGHEARLLCVRDRPWWGTWSKRLPRPLKAWWRWDPIDWANAQLVQAVAQDRPDVILEMQGDVFRPDILRQIKRRYGSTLVVWRTEGSTPDGIPAVVAEYDLVLTISRIDLERLRAAGLSQVAYLPYATDPGWFHPARRPRDDTATGVGFVGAYSPRREALLEALSDTGLRLWGPDWDTKSASPRLRNALQHARGIFGQELVRCYQTNGIFLSIPRENNVSVPTASSEGVGTGLGWRHFDVPACGGLVLSEWVVELPEAFTPGEDIETFRTAQELREKVTYLVTHNAQRVAMAHRARARVLREHTYAHRVGQLLRLLDRVRSSRSVSMTGATDSVRRGRQPAMAP